MKQIYQIYRVNLLPATNTKCTRGSVYELNNNDGIPVHKYFIPMDYRFNDIISCVVRELECRNEIQFINWYYLNKKKDKVIIIMKRI